MRFLLPIALLAPLAANAGDILVPQDSTLEQAVSDAVSGDRILVAAGTYNQKILVDNKNITIEAQSGTWELSTGNDPAIEVKGSSQAIIRDFSLPTKNNSRGLLVRENQGATAVFEDCTVTGRLHDDHGGGLKVDNGAQATVRRCTFDANNVDTRWQLR